MSKEEQTNEELDAELEAEREVKDRKSWLLFDFYGSRLSDAMWMLAYDRAENEWDVDFDEAGWKVCGMCSGYSDINEFVCGSDADPCPAQDDAICNSDWPTLVEAWARRIWDYYQECIIPNARDRLMEMAEDGETPDEDGFLGRMLQRFTTKPDTV